MGLDQCVGWVFVSGNQFPLTQVQYSEAVGLGVERSAMFELMLTLMPVCQFYDKVVLEVVGCSGVGALLQSMYSVHLTELIEWVPRHAAHPHQRLQGEEEGYVERGAQAHVAGGNGRGKMEGEGEGG